MSSLIWKSKAGVLYRLEAMRGRSPQGSILREDAVMLFAGGMRIEGRERILESLGAQPWESFRIEHPTTIVLCESAATLTYEVTAQREGSEPYTALVSSTYVRSKDWQLVVHQQTPT